MFPCPLRLELRQGYALLPHIFAGAVGVADFARLVALEEQELARAFVGVHLGGKRRGVREFERHMAFPAGLERGYVHDNPAPRIGRFAEADDEHVAGYAEIFDRPGEREAVWRD